MSRAYPNERWDRDRFEAYRGPGGSYERNEFEERDQYASPPRSRAPPTQFAPRPPVEERDRYFYEERDRYGGGGSRQEQRYFEEDIERDRYSGAMVPVRRDIPRERDSRDLEIDIRSRERYDDGRGRDFKRPQFMRRQSSLDTYDRRPMPRYGDRVREEVIPVPAPPHRRSPPRWRSPPRYVNERERDYYEDIRIQEPEFYGDEEFRGYREREISRVRKNRSPTIIEEREEIIEEQFPKRGKTKMPARLVEEKAILQCGYTYEREVCEQQLGRASGD